MPRTTPLKNTGPDTLDRWPKEKAQHHRALLLLAMQDPGSNPSSNGPVGGRNVSLVVQCMRGSVQRTTVQKWVQRRRWYERITSHGHEAQAYAIELYRALYMEGHGEKDLEILAPVISLPMTTVARPTGVSQTAVEQEARRIVDKILPPDPPPEVQEQVESVLAARREKALEANSELQGVAMDAVKAVGQAIKAAVDAEFREANPHIKPIVCRLSDLPRLRQMLAMLEEEEHRLTNPEIVTPDATVAGPAVIDSVRVRIAKESGGNVLEAIRDDAAEVLAIANAMLAEPKTLQDLEAERQSG